MKLLLVSLSVFILCAEAGAQVPALSRGTIVYEQKIQNRRPLTGLSGIDPDLAERMARTRTRRFELLFSPQASLYRVIEENELPEAGGEGQGQAGGMRMAFRNIGGQSNHLYRNLITGTSLQEVDIAGETYLVADTLRRVGMLAGQPDSLRRRQGRMKLQPDSVKIIAGYRCQRAVIPVEMRTLSQAQQTAMRRQVEEMRQNAMNGNGSRSANMNFEGDSSYTSETILWYTTNIPVQSGPSLFGNMPGMVLEVSADGGRMVTTAVEVAPVLREKELKEPGRGRRLTPAEYREKQRAFMEQMREGRSGGMRMERF